MMEITDLKLGVATLGGFTMMIKIGIFLWILLTKRVKLGFFLVQCIISISQKLSTAMAILDLIYLISLVLLIFLDLN